jgi:hypothetical protein
MTTLDGHLDPGEQTLGVHVDLSHAAPTPIGADVVIDVELTLVDGRQLTFDVRAHDDSAPITQGTHRRAVIDRPRIDARLAARSKSATQGPFGPAVGGARFGESSSQTDLICRAPSHDGSAADRARTHPWDGRRFRLIPPMNVSIMQACRMYWSVTFPRKSMLPFSARPNSTTSPFSNT